VFLVNAVLQAYNWYNNMYILCFIQTRKLTNDVLKFTCRVFLNVPHFINCSLNILGFEFEFLACRSRQASIVLERYFRFEVSLLSFYACEQDGPIQVSGGSDSIT